MSQFFEIGIGTVGRLEKEKRLGFRIGNNGRGHLAHKIKISFFRILTNGAFDSGQSWMFICAPVTHFKPVAARVFKEDGVVTRLVIHRAFDIAGARLCRDFRNSTNVRRPISPKRYSVFVGKVIRRFGDAEKLRGLFTCGFKLQPRRIQGAKE